MSYAEDNPDPDRVELSEEAKAIKFEWTPELVKIGTSRGAIHPSIGPIELQHGWPIFTYRSDMELPDPGDTLECLKWVGLSDQKAIELEQSFRELYPDYQASGRGYDEEHSANGKNMIIFPLLDKMVDFYIKELPMYSDDYEYTHESYIKRGIQLGLRPEFAIFCGLHETDPRAVSDPRLFEENWFNRGPEDIIADFLTPFWMQLKKFMAVKLVHEGKAWQDAHGKWLVHEGETMDQANARVDDTERKRLREEAIKESERIKEQRRQAREKYWAEENARLEEEQTVEDDL